MNGQDRSGCLEIPASWLSECDSAITLCHPYSTSVSKQSLITDLSWHSFFLEPPKTLAPPFFFRAIALKALPNLLEKPNLSGIESLLSSNIIYSLLWSICSQLAQFILSVTVSADQLHISIHFMLLTSLWMSLLPCDTVLVMASTCNLSSSFRSHAALLTWWHHFEVSLSAFVYTQQHSRGDFIILSSPRVAVNASVSRCTLQCPYDRQTLARRYLQLLHSYHFRFSACAPMAAISWLNDT